MMAETTEQAVKRHERWLLEQEEALSRHQVWLEEHDAAMKAHETAILNFGFWIKDCMRSRFWIRSASLSLSAERGSDWACGRRTD
jgi:hypothetical protein